MPETTGTTIPSRVIAIANQKGGVGKTTTSINVAASMAHLGHPTLVIDLDPQGNLSSGLGVQKDTVEQGTAELLLEYAELDAVIVETAQPGLDLVPATDSLIGSEVELTQALGREMRLRNALSSLTPGRYEYVLLDCPPSLGFLTINALTAAGSVLVPVQAEYYAMEGLGELLRTLSKVRKALNSQLVREGIIVTLHDSRNNLCRDVEAQVRDVFKEEVFDTVIPRNVRLGEAPSFGSPILSYDPASRGAEAYLGLARELLSRHGATGLIRQEAS
ncbi:MAG: ParA family protein [Myxococcota bacterium]|nr:ParA family protein [Myxococcota bacterium]